MNLIICEKESVANDFYKALSNTTISKRPYYIINNYIIFYTNGHALELFEPEEYDISYKKWNIEHLPIIINTFKYKIKNTFIINNLKNILKSYSFDNVIVATDAGREGELIARELINYFNNYFSKKNISFYRFWTSSALTKEVIINNLNSLKPLKNYDCIYKQALARQRIDWLIGINFSRYFTLKNNHLFTFGRLQTAILKIIYDNHISINNFVSKPYYKFKVVADNNIILYLLNNNHTTFDNINDIKNLNFVNCNLTLSKYDYNNKIIKRPLLPNLTAIQKFASQYFHISPSETLNIMQLLYEKYKVISYPRSSSRYIKSDMSNYIINIYKNILNINIDNNKLSYLINDNNISDHHAVICTNNFTSDDKSLLIIYNIIKFFMYSAIDNDYKYNVFNYYYIYDKYTFLFTFNKVVDIGWYKYYNSIFNIDILNYKEDNEEENVFYNNNISNNIKVLDNTILNLKTKPPKNYSYTSLLSFMEKNNLGTEATRANILDTLVKRKYIITNKNYISISDIGIEYINYLINYNKPFINNILDYNFTSDFEKKLDNNPDIYYMEIVNYIKLFFKNI
jgi:DNA topoisomerase-3